jgi:hypothetical protein
VTARLALAALGGTGGRVVLAQVAPDGTVGHPQEVDVPSGRSVGVDIVAGTAGLLLRADAGGGQVVAAIVLTATDVSGGLISVQGVRPGAQNSGQAPTVVQDPRIGLAAGQSSSR